MKRKILKFAAIALLLAGTAVACKEKETKNSGLKGTTWKLVGFVDVETGTLRKAVPEDCQRCYTITFDTDTTYSGEGCSNQMYGKYKIDYETSQIQIFCLGRDKAASYFDEELFFETLDVLQSFSLHEDELKLYYNDKKNCLLFKLKVI